ncbi:methylated-DNA--[protein]-cysteine S-methyltransferase [Paenibacillus rubinfantis]|jgi:methylated-DNA-[protein]-cysteine S-methyltransferase|uniref:methylated-DNA--[protein]-cysteine S-methyltransferase n=1 Tax=Paenibacillus rubinfantis TaxID=1720296 RepID=UPI00073E62CF|nr:methylated-DNA--[protein]-cysteine S-methyltransferase [Paenibacillus rubinfantis]
MSTTQPLSLYWSRLSEPTWSLYLAATDNGLAFVGSFDGSVDELTAWASRKFPGSPLSQDDRRLAPYAAELAAYLRGELQRFTLPMDLQGTPFQQAVWQALRSIPFGQTCSYSDIAVTIRKPSAVRAVGTAIGANPLLITIPCHRVIGKNGTLTGYRGGLEMKTRLLELEQAALAGGGR